MVQVGRLSVVRFTAIIVLCAAGLLSLVSAAYFATPGGCYGEDGRQTMRITSSEQNTAVASFLRRQKISVAGLAGYVEKGVPFWDDGTRVKWKPPTFALSSRDNGFIVIYSGDGSWGVKSFDDYMSTNFVCSDSPDIPSFPDSSSPGTTGAPESPTTVAPTAPPTASSSSSEHHEVTTTGAPPSTTPAPSQDSSSSPTPTPSQPSSSTHSPTTPLSPSLSHSPTPSLSLLSSHSSHAVEEEEPRENVMELLERVAVALGNRTLHLTAYAGNAVSTEGSIGAYVAHQMKLHTRRGVLFGVALGCGGGINSVTPNADFAALVADTQSDRLWFNVPLGLLENVGVTTTHTVCAAARIIDGSLWSVAGKGTVVVHPLRNILAQSKAVVTILAEDLMATGSVYKKLNFLTGAIPLDHMQAFSHLLTKELSLSMINNGVQGRMCAASTQTVDYFVDGVNLILRIPVSYAHKVRLGRKSICATLNRSHSVTIAAVALEKYQGLAQRGKYAYGEPIPVTVRGATQAAFTLGTAAYTAFLAHANDCRASHGSYYAKVENVLSWSAPGYSPSTKPPSRDAATADERPTVYLTALPQPKFSGTATTYLCMRSTATSEAFPVLNVANGKTVRVKGENRDTSGDAGGMLHYLRGMAGPLYLPSFVRPATSNADRSAAEDVLKLIMQASAKVRFVRMEGFSAAGTSSDKKQSACAATTTIGVGMGVGSSIVVAELPMAGGSIQLSSSFSLPLSGTVVPGGVLCVGGTYARIDYVSRDPHAWVRFVGGANETIRQRGRGHTNLYLSSSSVASDALTLETQDADASSIQAIRISPTEACSSGDILPLRRVSRELFVASFPTVSKQSAFVCIGLSSTTRTSAFVPVSSTGAAVVRALPFMEAVAQWAAANNIDDGVWDLASKGSVICGNDRVDVVAVPVRNGLASLSTMRATAGAGVAATLSPNWPMVYASYMMSGTSIHLRLQETSSTTSAAVVVDGMRPYILVDSQSGGTVSNRPLSRVCDELDFLLMSSDGLYYGTALHVSATDPVVQLSVGTALLGLPISALPHSSASCELGRDDGPAMMAVWNNAYGSTSIDFAPGIWRGISGLFKLCGLVGDSWRPLRLSYVYISTASDSAAAGGDVVANAIITEDAKGNMDEIHLWETETAVWGLSGSFFPRMNVWFSLMWGDPTCRASAAYTTPVNYFTENTATITIRVAQIATPPQPGMQLYSCYALPTGKDAGQLQWRRLPLEVQRNRSVSIYQLRLRSLNYLPMYAIHYLTVSNTTVMLTDPANAPIASLLLFSGQPAYGGPGNCSVTSTNFAATLLVTSDILGLQWVTIPPEIVRKYGSSTITTHFTLCATSTGAHLKPQYIPVSARLVIDQTGTDMTVNGAALNLRFSVVNGTQSVLDFEAASTALSSYAVSVSDIADPGQVLITDKVANVFGMYVVVASEVISAAEPHGTVDMEEGTVKAGVNTSAEAAHALSTVYNALAAGKHLPLVVESEVTQEAFFVLSSVEGVFLLNQSTYPLMPYIALRTTEGNELMEHDTLRIAIALFCIVIVPVVFGFVVFSVERQIPTLTRSNRKDTNEKSRKADEEGGRKSPPSPPPRDPLCHEKEMDYLGVTVVPKTENTVANPLYNDSDCDDDVRAPPGGRRKFSNPGAATGENSPVAPAAYGDHTAASPSMSTSTASSTAANPPNLASTAQQQPEPTFLCADF